MNNIINYFICPLKTINNYVVKGYGGVIKVRREGRIKYNIDDNYRQIHSIIIQNFIYITEVPIWMISPQQCYQQETDNHQKSYGTWWNTKDKHCILYWKQERYTCTIPWGAGTNTSLKCSMQSTNTYHILVAEIKDDLNSEDRYHVRFNGALILDEEGNGNRDSLRHHQIRKIYKDTSNHKQEQRHIFKPTLCDKNLKFPLQGRRILLTSPPIIFHHLQKWL